MFYMYCFSSLCVYKTHSLSDLFCLQLHTQFFERSLITTRDWILYLNKLQSCFPIKARVEDSRFGIRLISKSKPGWGVGYLRAMIRNACAALSTNPPNNNDVSFWLSRVSLFCRCFLERFGWRGFSIWEVLLQLYVNTIIMMLLICWIYNEYINIICNETKLFGICPTRFPFWISWSSLKSRETERERERERDLFVFTSVLASVLLSPIIIENKVKKHWQKQKKKIEKSGRSTWFLDFEFSRSFLFNNNNNNEDRNQHEEVNDGNTIIEIFVCCWVIIGRTTTTRASAANVYRTIDSIDFQPRVEVTESSPSFITWWGRCSCSCIEDGGRF